jgi:sugar lactone lactonase YvrE
MSSVRTRLVIFSPVTTIYAFLQDISALLATVGIVSAIFLVLTTDGISSRQLRRRVGRFLRYAAPGLLVLLASGFVWGTSSQTVFGGVATTLSTGKLTLNNPEAVAVDSLGNVYIADSENARIVEVTAAGVASVVAFPGLNLTEIVSKAVAVDGLGNLYVADISQGRVIELSGGIASVISTGSLLSEPDGLALDAAGNLYIADTGKRYIVEVPAGGVATVLAITGLGTPLGYPAGLAVDVSGNLYIADPGNNRIVEVAAGGAGSVLTISGLTLSYPNDVAFDSSGNLYIADLLNLRIVTVTPAGVAAVLSTGSYTLNNPSGLAVDGSGTVYIADQGNNRVVEVKRSPLGFGHVQVGAASGTTLTLGFTIGSGDTLGTVRALTLGAPNLDFKVVASGTTCTSHKTNAPCSVNIAFLPTAAGLRRGAVVLFNDVNPPVPILTVPLYGIGDAPLGTLSPGTASVLNTGTVATLTPFQIALDGTGNQYVADYGSHNVVRVPPGGGSANVVYTGNVVLSGPQGVALDAAGNLFISDYTNSLIVEVTAEGVTSVLSPSGPVLGLNYPNALALDTADDLYIADSMDDRIVEVTPAGVWSVLGTGSYTLGSVQGVAVDAAGNVYIADADNNRIVKVTAQGVASLVVTAGLTLSEPLGVGLDGMGNLYIVDSGNNRIVEVTLAGVTSVLQTPGLVTGLSFILYGVTIDTFGNVLIPDFYNNRLVEVNVTGASLTFPNTALGSTSNAQTATVTNIGDLPLVFALSPAYPTDYSEPSGATDQCLVATPLAPGTVCDVSVQFAPQSAVVLNESITLTDNNLNVSNATQIIAVSGTGIAPGDATAVTVSASPTAVNVGQPITVTVVVTDTAAGHTSTIPTGGVTFIDTVGSTVVTLNGGSAVTLNGAGMAILSGVTLSGAGAHTITANYVGVSGSFEASSNTTPVTVTADVATVTGPATQPVVVANGQTGSVLVTVTGPYSLVAVPTGSLTYTVLNSSSISVASGTATLTTGSTNSTATAPIPSSLPPGVYTVSVSYGGDSNYAPSAAPITIQVVVSPIVPTINWIQPAAITYGATLGGILNASAVSGSTAVAGSFAYTATPQGGSAATVTSTTVLGGGIYTLTAIFTPAVPATYGPASASVSLTVAKAIPAVVLSSSANTVVVMSAVTFTATVSSAISVPSGSVNFYDGPTLLGSGTLALGVATFTTSSLPAGALLITAAYSGDGNFSALTSPALTETVSTSYSITAPTTPVMVEPGGSVTINISVPPLGGAFDSVVTLSASGLPPGATATFNPPTVTPGTTGATSVMTIQLAARGGNMIAGNIPARHRGLPFASFSMVLVMFGAVLGRKRFSKALVLAVVLAGLGISMSLITGCGATAPSQAGNYKVTVTGTSGSFETSTTVMLVVE